MTDLSKLMQNAALLDVIDKSADEASSLSAQNSYQSMRIEELESELSKLKEIADSQLRTINALMVGMPDEGTTPVIRRIDELEREADKLRSLWDAEFRRAERAEAERDALKQDAKRYRWLREYNLDSADNDEFFGIRREELDEVIDAAILAMRKP